MTEHTNPPRSLPLAPQLDPPVPALMFEAALNYAARGWYVFPCYTVDATGKCTCGQAECKSPGKHPDGRLVSNGVNGASLDPEQIKRWWTARPLANIAIAAGRSGLIIFDIDPRHGGDESALRDLVGDDFSETVRVKTPSIGTHIYLAEPDSGPFTVFVAKVAPGIDIRAGAGYVIAPPSRHLKGGSYEFEIGYAPDEIDVRVCPLKLSNYARQARDSDRTERAGE